MRNIIIRLALDKGDVTFVATRLEYIEHSKNNSRIIFAIEYPSQEIALREIALF